MHLTIVCNILDRNVFGAIKQVVPILCSGWEEGRLSVPSVGVDFEWEEDREFIFFQ